MSRLLQKEKLKKKIKNQSSNSLMKKRDTTASLKRSLKRRNRYTTITISPIGESLNNSIISRNSYRLKNNSICIPNPCNNQRRKQRINSYCASPFTSLSIDPEFLKQQQQKKSVVRRYHRSNWTSPLRKTLKYLKSKIQRKKSISGSIRQISNKRSCLGSSTMDSKPTNVTSSENPVINSEFKQFRIGFSKNRIKKFRKPKFKQRFSAAPKPIRALRLGNTVL